MREKDDRKEDEGRVREKDDRKEDEVRRKGGEVGEQKQGGELKEIVGLFGDPSEVLARTVGEGVRKMMKEREG